MMQVNDFMAVIGCLVGVAGAVLAFVTWMANKDKSVKQETKETIETRADLQSQINIVNSTITTRLDAIDNGVRDLKADNRGFRSELTKMRDDLHDEMKKVHDEAKHGVELAEAAHRRLDRMGAEPDILVQRIRKGE